MSLNSVVQLAEIVDNPILEETTPEIPESNPISSQDLEDLKVTITTLNDNILILNDNISSFCNNNASIDVIDYSEKLDVVINRQEIIATNLTILTAGTAIIFVLFILYSAIRKFVDY